ncbi:hypothetical protein BH09BAC6_BH09BAC6_06670 [soil metagenome]
MCAVFSITAVGRYYNRHSTVDWNFLLFFFVFLMFCAVILGYIDYRFYEKEAKRLILKLLNQSPLKDFHKTGFIYEDEDKMSGYINNFYIVLAPTVDIKRCNFLAILIPLKIQEGAEKYFTKFDDLFKFTFDGQVLFAQALIENYTKTYDFNILFSAIKETTELLIERNIQPIEVIWK